jgi:hypothetical protein
VKRAVALALLIASAVPLSGCIIVPPGRPSYCYYYRYRCR